MITFGVNLHLRTGADGRVVIEDWRERKAPRIIALTVEESMQLRQSLESAEGRAIDFMRRAAT